MSELGRGIDEFKVDGFQELAGSSSEERFSEEDESLLRSNTAALDDDEVVSDNTIVGESSQRSDVLFSEIGISGCVVLGASSLALSDSVDLLVELSSVEIA